ncbi:diguanylate cyclase domain-containing protein [Meridianimarinicoccus sp. MJW13]|uniref:GGDEF domain-containing protein n=1 Tax=Meridianimarinicoccus sp. MJW13 TaxID=2720031 RepID=UPI00299F8CF3|nr:diguanylate cyclase [Fluviibacterium sp. MJW13]
MTPPVILGAGEGDALMPLHMRLSPCGTILHTGPTLAKLRKDSTLVGRKLFDVFRLRRPHLTGASPQLSRLIRQRLQVQFREPPETSLNGLMVTDATGESLLVNFSFGTGLVDAIRDYDLHLPDFAATDPSIEMLYLIEANATVLDEWRRLNLRLQSAKMEAEKQAYTDTLTGLRNRRALDHVLGRLVEAGEPFGVIHLDLDFFKQVNDTLGHAAGDHVLQVAAKVMVQTTRAQDTLIRAGGDEFVILLPGTVDHSHLLRLAERLIERLEEPIPFGDEVCRISGSAGITVCHGGGKPADAVLQEADEALYASKARGRGCATLYRAVAGASVAPFERKAARGDDGPTTAASG